MAKLKQYVLEKLVSNSKKIQIKVAHDIDLEIRLMARRTSAEYVSERMMGVTSFTDKRHLLDFCLRNVEIEGSYLEFGVFKGESIRHIAKQIQPKGRKIHGFDSFEGLPEYWRPGYDKAVFNVGGRIPQNIGNIEFHKGWFNETLPTFVANTLENVAFLHIDCDLYSSTQTIFNELKGKIVAGTIICFDEYFNHPWWEQGEYKAFQEFIKESQMRYEYIAYTSNNEQVAVRIL